MGISKLSKQAFAQELEKMIKTVDLEKIRVTQLAKNVGATTQAFYYHFQDKYDLIAWIYIQDYSKIVKKNTISFSPEQIMQLMMQFATRKTFYQRAFTDKSQNAIENYASKYTLDLIKIAVEKYQDSPITSQQILQLLYHNYGVLGLFKDWIFDKIEIDIYQLAEFQYNKTPQFIKDALVNYYK